MKKKKELKKRLELQLAIALEDVFTKDDSVAARKIRKHIRSAVKSLVKKFIKTLSASFKKTELVKKTSSRKTPIKRTKLNTAKKSKYGLAVKKQSK